MTQTKYRITRTGRRATPLLVKLADGSTRRLNPTGGHVWPLTDPDVVKIRALPGVRVTLVNPTPAPTPAPTDDKPKAKGKGKGKKKGK